MSDDTKLGSMPLLSSKGGVRHFGNGIHMLQLWSNICIIETDDGVVLFDVGFAFNGRRIVEEVRSITDKPVRYIVYGHGHADHSFGSRAVIKDADARGYPRPVIIGHDNLPRRFDRYRETLEYQAHINRIQFEIPDQMPAFPEKYTYPDQTYSDVMRFQVGGTAFELRHAMGETDDTTWMWIPERKTVCVSDLWVWSCPNIGNPFKVQRYEVEWAQALEEIASLSPELLLPGHGGAIQGADEIGSCCRTVAKALRFLHDQVIRMLNQGKWQEEILQSFEWPEEFAQSPYLASIYGHPYFIVQAVLRRYHGWFDGNESHLFPSSTSEIAREILSLVGEPVKILDRARDLDRQGKTQLALHMVDLLIDSGSEQKTEALLFKSQLLKIMAQKEQSLIARNIFLGGIRRIDKLLKSNP